VLNVTMPAKVYTGPESITPWIVSCGGIDKVCHNIITENQGVKFPDKYHCIHFAKDSIE